MTRVITSACIGTKAAACVQACPVDCIHPRPDEDGFSTARQLFINPNECIDCAACESACPVAAIFADSEVPATEARYIRLNAEHYA